jgi:hypothetical protein
MSMPSSTLKQQTNAVLHLLECHRILKKTNSNVVGEILRQSPTFYQWDHYPAGDVFDHEHAAQYYYHAHPPTERNIPAEHGHFHLFLRKAGMPAHVQPLIYPQKTDTNQEDLSHLIAIAMDKQGLPIGLFTTNRWVTGESWYAANDVCDMLDEFIIDHAWPSWPTNIWLTHMIILFKPEIVKLIKERDKTIAQWQKAHPDTNVYEDRTLEVTSYLPISLEEKINTIQKKNRARPARPVI